MYLSKNLPDAAALSIVQTSIENEDDNIDEYLGNDKTVEFTADTELLENTLDTDKCTVSENGAVMSEGYSISVEGNKIKVIFDDKLKGASKYGIKLDAGIVYNEYGMTTESQYSLTFETASQSIAYRMENSLPKNGAEDVPLNIDGNNTVTLTMNNEPENADELKNNIRIIKNNCVISSGYSIDVNEKNIYIKFDDELDADSEYTVKLPDYVEDKFANTISGDLSVVFCTKKNSDDAEILFSMGDPNTHSSINFNKMFYKESENARIYDETLHYTIPASVAADMNLSVNTDISQYQYLNLWMYSPKEASSGFTITGWDNSGGYFRAHQLVNWSGWKLITFKIADFAISGSGKPSWQDVTSIRISVNGWTGYIAPWQEDSYLCIDDIFLSKVSVEEPRILGTSLPKNYKNAPISDVSVDFVCSNALGGINKSCVRIYDSNNNYIEDFDTEIIGSKLSVKLNRKLDDGTEYTIYLPDNCIYDRTGAQISDNITYTFTTMSPGISVGIPVFRQGDRVVSSMPTSGSDVTVSVLADNGGAEDGDVILAAIQYDAGGNTIDIQKQEVTISAGESDRALECVLNIKDEAKRITAFVCDKNMKPLRGEAAYLNGNNATQKFYADSETAALLSIDYAKINNSELAVTGTYSGLGTVLVKVTDSDGNDIHWDAVSADGGKQFGTICDLGEDAKDGQYTVTVSALDADSAWTEVLYLSNKTKQEILSQVNAAASVSEMTQIVNKYKSVLQIEGLPQTSITNISNTLYEQKTYKTYNKILSTISNADALLESLNKLQWSEITAFLSANSNIVMCGEETYKYYSSLSGEKKNAINTVIVKSLPQSDFVAFRRVFASAVNDYKNSTSQSSPSGTVGNGGGGGGGIGTNVIGIIKPAEAPQTAKDNYRFEDMNGYLWAEEYVNNLFDRNVISMSEDKRFRPGDNITREEYVKMIVVAFGISTDEKESGYTDAVSGAWYQPYLAAATKVGITEGSDDGNFGVGKPITRQDMAVIAYRAVNLTGKSLPVKNEAIVFADNDAVSDYAAAAVSKMSAAGIIEGMENAKFEPLINAQRAQAAKIISELADWRDNI
ncbi:MAG: S-layer homology domain-containing protein [Clostridia bacterium]|nr:S-layer homology domain-containing protein [Clostridia bacterium]